MSPKRHEALTAGTEHPAEPSRLPPSPLNRFVYICVYTVEDFVDV